MGSNPGIGPGLVFCFCFYFYLFIFPFRIGLGFVNTVERRYEIIFFWVETKPVNRLRINQLASCIRAKQFVLTDYDASMIVCGCFLTTLIVFVQLLIYFGRPTSSVVITDDIARSGGCHAPATLTFACSSVQVIYFFVGPYPCEHDVFI